MLSHDGSRLRVAGALTMETVPAMLERSSTQLVGTDRIDLSAVTDVDSAAVALVLAWQREARQRGAALAIEGAPAAFHNLARLYGVTEYIAPPS